MTQTLELQAWTLKNKKIMINVLQALMKKVDNIQDQIGNFRDIETTNQWEMLKIKNIVTEMKNASDRLINRNAYCLEGISELDDKTTESTQTGNAKGKKVKNKQTNKKASIQELGNNNKWYNIEITGILGENKSSRNTPNFSRLIKNPHNQNYKKHIYVIIELQKHKTLVLQKEMIIHLM